MPTDFQTGTRSACVSQAEEKLIQMAEMVISYIYIYIYIWLCSVVVMVMVTERRQKAAWPVVVACWNKKKRRSQTGVCIGSTVPQH